MKRNRRFDELIAKIPKETMERVKKQMTCKWLINGDECGLKGSCNPDNCKSWEHYEEERR